MSSETTASSVNSVEKRSTAKLDSLRQIENNVQQQWAAKKAFEADAPEKWTDKFVIEICLCFLFEIENFYFEVLTNISSLFHIHI